MSCSTKRWGRFHHQYQESIVTFLCPNQYDDVGWQALLKARNEVEDFICEYPDFKVTHKPFPDKKDFPENIQKMCRASAQVQIGPMSTIAGVMAEAALSEMVQAGAQEVVVDNGGDIVLVTKEKVNIGIFAGDSQLKNLAFQLDPQIKPLAICTSSGKIGHSFSYGKADAAIVFSHHIALADAAATALGNRVKDPNDLENCFILFEDIAEITGALVIIEDKMGMWGHLPEIIQAEVDDRLITRERIFS